MIFKSIIRNTKYNTIVKNKSHRKKKIIILNSILNLLAFVFLIIGRYLYIKSLFGCNGGEFQCIHNIGLSYIKKDIHYCIKSVLYFLLFLFMIQLKLCSIYQLIAFFVVLIELIVKDRGDSILNHGIMNLYALFLLLSLGEIFILILIFTFKFFICIYIHQEIINHK